MDGRIARFAVVGTLGFVVDASVLTWLLGVGWNVYAARGTSFALATLVTWLANRKWTFVQPRRAAPEMRREYARYFIVQTAGALTNLGVFFLLTNAYAALLRVPYVPLAVGAVFGLIVNYTGSRLWVFRGHVAADPGASLADRR